MIPRHRSHRSMPIHAAAALAFTVLAWPAPAAAQDDPGEIQFDYGVDGVSWYWSRQIDETLELGSIAQQVEWPNPQSATTMPVAVELGETTKVAALSFNLAERGVTEGSTITDFQLTVAEGDDPGDSPTFNPTGKLVQACPVTEAWSSGEAEMWDVQPPVGEGCVVGERAEPDPAEVADAEALIAATQEAIENGGRGELVDEADPAACQKEYAQAREAAPWVGPEGVDVDGQHFREGLAERGGGVLERHGLDAHTAFCHRDAIQRARFAGL